MSNFTSATHVRTQEIADISNAYDEIFLIEICFFLNIALLCLCFVVRVLAAQMHHTFLCDQQISMPRYTRKVSLAQKL